MGFLVRIVMFGIKLRRKMPYSQLEVSEQISHIGRLIEQQKDWPTKLGQDTVETAREVLAFMLDENVTKSGRKHERAI